MRLRNILLGLGTIACVATAAAAAPPETVNDLVRAVQGDDRLDFPLEELATRASAQYRELQAWRIHNPDDLAGMIALGQITWLLDRLEPHTPAAGANLDTGSPRNTLAQQELQRAGELYPQTAAVHYWRAQLYASPIVHQISGRLTARPIDLDKAIEQAQQAVALDQTDVQLRDTLAFLLTDAYRDDEAGEILRQGNASETMVQRLLLDLRAIPLPVNAQLLAEDSRRFAEDQLVRGRIGDSLYLRARVYLLPLSAQQFEASCRERWPEFRLLAPRQATPSPAWRSHAMQVLLLGGGEPRPITTLEQLDVAAMDGISLTLVEFIDPPDKQRRQSPAGVALPADLGKSFVYLYVLNDRTLH